jgi:hypothetical protein
METEITQKELRELINGLIKEYLMNIESETPMAIEFILAQYFIHDKFFTTQEVRKRIKELKDINNKKEVRLLDTQEVKNYGSINDITWSKI